jgi:zinc protease
MKLLLIALCLTTAPAHAAFPVHLDGKNQNFLYEADAKALASTVQIAFRTGSLSDPAGKEGLAKLSFQSLLRGTKTKSRKEFFAAMERLGASVSADTGSNRTILTVSAVSENLGPAIELMAEAILNPGLRDEDIRALQEEEIAALQQEMSNNRALLQRVTRQALFGGTGLAFPPNGTLSSMAAIEPKDVREFLAKRLKSGNMVVAAASNHSLAEVQGWITEAFAEMPEGQAPAVTLPELPEPEGRVLYVLERKGSSTTEVAIAHPGMKSTDPERELVGAGLFIFGGDMSSRLFQVLRGQNGWTYGAYATMNLLDRPRRHGSAFTIYAFPQAQHTEKLVLKSLEMYEEFIKKGATGKELTFAKQSLVNSYPFEFATSQKRLTSRLYELLDGAKFHSVASYRRMMKGLNRQRLHQVIKRHHQTKNLAIVLVGDPAHVANLKKSIPNLKKVVEITDSMQSL